MVRLISEATRFAIEKHGDQKYGRKPYEAHLIDVVNVLRRFLDWDDLQQEFIDACWLHDVIEDTGVTREQVEALFGPRVARLVHAVSNEPGPNRKERHEKTYPKVRATENAILVKLCDRVANVENSISHDRFGRPPQKIFGMYLKEYDEFCGALRGRCAGENVRSATGTSISMLWTYLDELMAEGKRKADEYRDLKAFRGKVSLADCPDNG